MAVKTITTEKPTGRRSRRGNALITRAPRAGGPHPSGPSTAAVLERMRRICQQFPETSETVTFGHPTFQVAGKTFAALEEHKGELGIALTVGKLMQGVFLKDSRFFMTPYAGKHGWVTLRVYAAPLNWEEIRELLQGSYQLVSAKTVRWRNKRRD